MLYAYACSFKGMSSYWWPIGSWACTFTRLVVHSVHIGRIRRTRDMCTVLGLLKFWRSFIRIFHVSCPIHFVSHVPLRKGWWFTVNSFSCHLWPFRTWVSNNTQLPATFAHITHTLQKFHNNLDSKVHHSLILFHVRPANQPTIKGVARCLEKVGDLCFTGIEAKPISIGHFQGRLCRVSMWMQYGGMET
jgi:hypothetical protein